MMKNGIHEQQTSQINTRRQGDHDKKRNDKKRTRETRNQHYDEYRRLGEWHVHVPTQPLSKTDDSEGRIEARREDRKTPGS